MVPLLLPLLLALGSAEQGGYLRLLFGHYGGANGTLPSEGLARLLGSLGLGRVRVVRIQHEELGHGHVSHLDLLEVQEERHRHRHPLWEHGGDPGTPTPGSPRPEDALKPGPTESRGAAPVPGLSLLGRVLGLEPSGAEHPNHDCLNVSQLLVSVGLEAAAQLTPEQFSLLCPALLYQIDSRVCIQHSDDVELPPPGGGPWAALGWGLLAVAFISLPSAGAVALVPLLSRSFFRSLLAFLVALAVGTLCGDALLHLWPHAQGQEPEAAVTAPSPAVLQGLAVLGGIYLLFLLELLLGMLRRSREATGPTPNAGAGVLAPLRGAGAEPRPEVPEAELELRAPGAAPHGHSHGPALPPGPAAADVVWMVVLGDGVHNLTDGLAIGAAFSHSIPSGLSTALAVLCHELPHELGDLAVLLQAGTAPRTLLLLNLLSALLSCLGAAAGAAVGQSAAHLTPWILTLTAGIFLYVALADMRNHRDQRHGSDEDAQVWDAGWARKDQDRLRASFLSVGSSPPPPSPKSSISFGLLLLTPTFTPKPAPSHRAQAQDGGDAPGPIPTGDSICIPHGCRARKAAAGPWYPMGPQGAATPWEPSIEPPTNTPLGPL